MSDEYEEKQEDNGAADAVAATAIIAVAVFTIYLWLSGMPG
ncbi:MAG: hypothetical protein AAGI44_20800 [Pseudomonadota bacterium]